jgi:hypothetical protein
LATGKPLLRIKPQSRCRVWYFCGEDPEDEIVRRFAGIQKHYQVKNSELNGWLYFESGLDKLRKIADQYGVIDHQVLREIRQFILEHKIDVVVFDPFVKMHYAPESDNTMVDMVVTALSEVANECDCSIVLVDHNRKAKADETQTSDNLRGASSKRDAARNIRSVSMMTSEEAKLASIEAHDRWRFFSVEEAKYNMTAPPQAKDWYERDQAFLDNNSDAKLEGDGSENPRGDAIGVVKPFAFPKADKLDPSMVEVAKVQAALGSEPKWKAHINAKKEWVGVFVAQVLGYDITKNVNRPKVRKMVDDWTAKGWLKIMIAKDPKTRHDREYVVAGNAVKGSAPVVARQRDNGVVAGSEGKVPEVPAA